MQVDPTSSSSGYLSDFAKLEALSSQERSAFLHVQNPTDLVRLFQEAVNVDSPTIRQEIFNEINQQNLDSHELRALVLQIFPQLSSEAEATLKDEMMGFLRKTVTEENAPELIAFAIQNRSQELLDQCLMLLKDVTGASFECENFGPLTIKINDSSFQRLQTVLTSLKNRLDNSHIRIEIMARATVTDVDLRKFVVSRSAL